eukprot:2326567-Pleurochrysis_carterae.AAC.2
MPPRLAPQWRRGWRRPTRTGSCAKPRTRRGLGHQTPPHRGLGGKIANHASSGSWTTIKRFEGPNRRSLVRLIWVYKRKRSGALKARLCVQSCARMHGIDYDQKFCATMRLTCLCTLAAIANSAGMSMRR